MQSEVTKMKCDIFMLCQTNSRHVPTVFDTYVEKIVFNGMVIHMELWDTAGQEGYDRLRPLSYNKVIINCALIT